MAQGIESKIRRNPKVAILSRNYPEYLKSAVEISQQHPERLITFRASTSWKSTLAALKYCSSLPIYFVPTGGGAQVEYEATLHTVLLNPKSGDIETKKLLAFCLDETKDEGLWSGEVHTLYVIRLCHKLPKPFPMTSLVKVSDNQPISERYGYSYSIVYEYSGEFGDEIEVYPEEVPDDKIYIEGAVRKVSVNAYERSKAARQKCIEHYGLDCLVCGINFGKKYGKIGEGFIHVHHLKSLDSVNEKYTVNPINDLVPVCANCHAMLHRRTPSYSVKDLQKKMKTRSQAKRKS